MGIFLTESSVAQLANGDAKARWQLDLEVDVAHLQQRYRLLNAEADLGARVQRLEIGEGAFREVEGKEGVDMDKLCNIGAIHATLYGGEEGNEQLAHTCMVVDLFRDGFEEGDGIDSIARRMYGVTDLSKGNV